MAAKKSRSRISTAKVRVRSPDVERGSWGPLAFADRHEISVAKLYSMWRTGTGPRFVLIGSQRRVTVEHEKEWLQKLASAQQSAAA
jgi:hypothetical protein